jgi:uncharacterized protein (DUF362 family)/Pyruvate/2-oxoacid:ferredoxin oxidoreductase delta subunit
MSKVESVALVRCTTYDLQQVRQQLTHLLAPLGGMAAFVTAGQRVLLKPNLLSAKPPSAAVTTHPVLVQAVAELVQQAGGQVLIGDSPGIGSLERVAEKSGIAAVAKGVGAQLVVFQDTQQVSGSGVFRQFELSREYLAADVVINLPKLKTHEMMTLTCGVKNLYGTVVGAAKAGLHLTAGRSKELFAGLLLEIAQARPVALTIVDAICAMEGDGPSSGTPRQVGWLLAGGNPVAVDLVPGRLAGIPHELLPVEQEARRRKLPGANWEEVELVGEPFVAAKPPFRLPGGLDVQFGLPVFLKDLLRNQLAPLPAADRRLCVLCGVCRDACPPRAITLTKNALTVDSGRCIRCWCCRELCPHQALVVKRGLVLRLLGGRSQQD